LYFGGSCDVWAIKKRRDERKRQDGVYQSLRFRGGGGKGGSVEVECKAVERLCGEEEQGRMRLRTGEFIPRFSVKGENRKE